jgi:hypothetical protein
MLTKQTFHSIKKDVNFWHLVPKSCKKHEAEHWAESLT